MNSVKFKIVIIGSILVSLFSFKPTQGYEFAVLKYNGGGDWYSNPSALPNLVKFCNENLNTTINPAVKDVDVGSVELFNYPFIHMTGHGNVVFSANEAENLRKYLIGGGFLHISDNYGMDKFVRTEMKKVFPELEFIELPFNHKIYHQKYNFNKGLPKIHEHDNKAPQGFGLEYEGRLVCFYDFECDLGDGWEDEAVHNDSKEARTKALQMGANIVQYALIGE
ncbi:MAG: DUF4159 domain-containing protein [Flavobacteriales bacterium]|jgi:hypothetical protein|nr:DUF4159 domain-containing protein [Flavobacteriales bacterium]